MGGARHGCRHDQYVRSVIGGRDTARGLLFDHALPALPRSDGLPARLDLGGAAMPTLAASDPPVHTTHRRAVFPELVARRMHTLEHDIRALSESTVKQALRDEKFDFMAAIGNIVPITVIARLIGFRDIDPMQLLEAAFDSTTMVGGTMSLDELNTLVTRTGTIQAWIADQITDISGRRGRRDPAGRAAGVGCRHPADGRGHHHPAHPAERGRRIHDQPAGQRGPDARGGSRRCNNGCAKSRKISTCSLRRRCGSSRRFGK